MGEKEARSKSSRFRDVLMRLMMDGHNIHLVKCSRTGRTFSHAVADAIIDTLVAEQVTACLQGRVFEVVAADRTKGKSLSQLVGDTIESRSRSCLTRSISSSSDELLNALLFQLSLSFCICSAKVGTSTMPHLTVLSTSSR